MTPPITHNGLRRMMRHLLATDSALADVESYIAQAELVEKERDELKAKLYGPYDTGPGGDDFTCAKHNWSSLGRCPTCATEDNARLATVVKEHGAALMRGAGFLERCTNGTPDAHIGEQALAAAKALAEVLK